MSTLRFTDPDHWEAIDTHLRGGTSERFAFAFTRLLADRDDGPVLRVGGVALVDDEDVRSDATGWTVSDPALDRIHNHAILGQCGLVEFHNHRRGMPGFSTIDEEALWPMAEYVLDVLGGRPYGAAVWTEKGVHAEWFRSNANGSIDRGGFRSITVIGERLAVLNSDAGVREDRFTRQIPILGEAGQSALRQLRVAVVGAGGTGSHAIMLLAYLGVRDFVLLDDDLIEITNLNRVITADPADQGAPKVQVARRRLQALDSSASVQPLPGVTAGSKHDELLEVDLIVGCVDHDGPRHRLNEIAVDAGIPYLDIGTGVDTNLDPPATGARICLVLPGGPCLGCTEELNPVEVARWYKPADQQLADRKHGYGLPQPDPSVVHLNGLAVNAAIAEVVAWISGARPPARRLNVDLDGDSSLPGVRVAPSTETQRRPGCVDCAGNYASQSR